MTIRSALASASAIALLMGTAGCVPGVSQGQSQQITKVLTQLGNTLTADLQQQAATAMAATPPDVDGARCAGTLPDPTKPIGPDNLGTGALAVSAAIQRVNAVNANLPIGALTTAEIGTLYQPGSAQFNWAVTTIETACIAKIHDVNQAINSTAGIMTALPSVLALAAAPAGAMAAPMAQFASNNLITVGAAYKSSQVVPALVVRDRYGNVLLSAQHADLR